MRVVVDTNVVVSGVFFGGASRRVVEAAVGSEVEAAATGGDRRRVLAGCREDDRAQGRPAANSKLSASSMSMPLANILDANACCGVAKSGWQGL